MRRGYILGVDEVGRGPLAGPVAVGVACVPKNFDWALLPGVGDSKKLTAAKRFGIYAQAKKLQAASVLDFEVVFTTAKKIDHIGIVPAITQALKTALKTVAGRQVFDPAMVDVKLDGGLVAPPEYVYQETIIKGDSKELVIGLASIVAKVTRDTYMEKCSKNVKYAQYEFATHKGYGTLGHRQAILRYGLSDLHRHSFCRKLVSDSPLK